MNPKIEEGQTTQWPKEKGQKRTNNDLQNTTHNNKYRVTRTPPKTGCELWCSGRVSSSKYMTKNARQDIDQNLVLC